MDIRDQESFRTQWYKDLDERAMRATVEVAVLDDERPDDGGPDEVEVVIPYRYEACSLCGGKGRHVNPAIDSEGISMEDFHRDPDFASDYMSGVYDVACYRCKGRRVEAVLDERALKAQDPKLYERVMRHMRALDETMCERIAESRYQY